MHPLRGSGCFFLFAACCLLIPASLAADDDTGNCRLTAANTALAADGTHVALSDAIQAPAVVIKTADGCPPCDYLVDWALDNAADYTKTHQAQLVVLKIIAGEPMVDPRLDRSDVVALHTPDAMLPAPLAGIELPAVYFFDADHALTGGQAGLAELTPQAAARTLTPPGDLDAAAAGGCPAGRPLAPGS